MGTLYYTYMDNNWYCDHHPICIGENFGDGTAWVSRQGGDGTGQNAYDSAITAAHEAGHIYYADDHVIDAFLDDCLSLIGWT